MSNREFIKEPGIYAVVIASALPTTSKAGNPMLAVEFKDIGDGRLIKAWIVANNEFALKRLSLLKQVCGLKEEAKAPDLVGCKLKIKVALQKNKPEYSEVSDYLPFSTPTAAPGPDADDNKPLPF